MLTVVEISSMTMQNIDMNVKVGGMKEIERGFGQRMLKKILENLFQDKKKHKAS